MLEEEAEDESDNPEDDSDIHKNDGGKATANHDRLDQLAELKNREKNVSPEPAERPASKNTKGTVNGYDKKAVDKIQQLGGKFTIMYSLWIANAQVVFQTQLDPEYMLRTRFQNGIHGRRQGEHANLLEVFPDEYHNNLAGDFIHPIFTYGMNNKCLNSASRIRTCLSPRIFGYLHNSFIDAAWCYENSHTLIDWKQDADGQAYYTPFAPILYRDYKDRPNIHNIFLNQALFDVFSVIIRGPSTLNRNRKPSAKCSTITMDIIWQLTEITPGAIAGAAIFVHYALSNNKSFQ
ncbi:hypothetical protein K439DRAFT_1622783 [Ramaria rubella]|nr:hypothetical protein K439DRAFT_1622783 [Ramaria rubella]